MEEIQEQEPWYKGPIKYILAIFLLLLIVLWLVPSYSVKLDPEPKNIPNVDAFDKILSDAKVGERTDNLNEAVKFLNPSDPVIKQIATTISSSSCEQSRICHAKALYYFVRDNIEYVSDPVGKEYIESPVEVLKSKGSDCESGSLLLAVLEESVGIESEIVLIPGHAYLRINLPNALNKYKRDGWIYLDWTCKRCEFGEVPYQNIGKEVRVLALKH